MTAVTLCQEGKTTWLSYGISPGALKASLIMSPLFSTVALVISLDLNEWELIYRVFLSFQSCTCRKWYWSIFFAFLTWVMNLLIFDRLVEKKEKHEYIFHYFCFLFSHNTPSPLSDTIYLVKDLKGDIVKLLLVWTSGILRDETIILI